MLDLLCGQTKDMMTLFRSSSNMAAVQEDQNALCCVLTVKCRLYTTTQHGSEVIMKHPEVIFIIYDLFYSYIQVNIKFKMKM